MASGRPAFVIGDIHGEREKLEALLRAAELIDGKLAWAGRDATLWFTGDFFDRGPDGVGAIELVMRLQREALGSGGRVGALLGNHEPLFLAVHRFEQRAAQPGLHFRDIWERNGGRQQDLQRLTPEHTAWLTSLPAMARHDDWLLIHADAMLYLKYGRSIEEANGAVRTVLESSDSAAWERLLTRFSERLAFTGRSGHSPREQIDRLLDRYGGRRIVHGHTPICLLTGVPAPEVTAPLVYADGRCVNIDGGMCLGGPGFLFELPPAAQDERPAPRRRSGWRLW